jgi:DNA-binding MarR family transcriptional regulator
MLLLHGFDAMVDEVVAQLGSRGHPGTTAAHEFALQAVDDGAQTASELARSLGVSRQAAAKSITALEELGYVERRADPSDGRRKQLIVTAHGYDLVRIGAALFDDIRARWSAQLGREHLEAIEAGLLALVATARERAGSDS